MALDETLHRVAEYFDVLGNGVRVKILLTLGHDEKHVSAIAEEIDRSQQVTSRHLKILRLEDIVQSESDGRKRIFWIKREKVLEDIKNAIKQFQRDNDFD